MGETARILIVDDEEEIRQLVAEFLEARGYSVISAASGIEALTALERFHPDLILLDVMMPRMNGLEALRRIREVDGRVGVIMLTAVEDEGVARQAMQSEAYDYVTKPVDFGYLELAILTKLARVLR
jgi:two-component system response regulator MprA